jgi:hypothetical protein
MSANLFKCLANTDVAACGNESPSKCFCVPQHCVLRRSDVCCTSVRKSKRKSQLRSFKYEANLRDYSVVCRRCVGCQHPAKDVPSDVQKALISLDKQWGEAGGDTAKLDKIIGDNMLAIGSKGDAQDKQQLIADNKATSANVQNASYNADEYKFEMLSPDVVVMTHRGTIKGTENGKEVTESHRSLHVFQKVDGQWRVVANAQLPIAK